MKKLFYSMFLVLSVVLMLTGCKDEDPIETPKFTVTFNNEGGSEVKAVMVEGGKILSIPSVPTKEEFIFVGWFKEITCVTAWDFETDVVNKDLTLYAKWTTSTRETLVNLLKEAAQISSFEYTKEAFSELMVKYDAAAAILGEETPTAQQIATVYAELSGVMNALVPHPYRAIANIYIHDIIDGIMYVNQGLDFYLVINTIDALCNASTDDRIIFTYDKAQLATWAEGDILVEKNILKFTAKSTLVEGSTINITVKSAEDPSISKIITLKVMKQGAIKTMFIDAVNTLPAPDKIGNTHYDLLYKASVLYNYSTPEEKLEPLVVEAHKKLLTCESFYYKSPSIFKYSFNKDVCTMIESQGVSTETNFGKYLYVADKSFPIGTYSSSSWMNELGVFCQYKFTLKSDGTSTYESRKAVDSNGKGATAWKILDRLTFTYTGTQASGGIFFIVFTPNEDTEQAVKLVYSTNHAPATHSINRL